MGCVYLAENVVSHDVYIGFTSRTLEWRRKFHLCNARLGYYPRSHFMNAIRRYGQDAFSWKILFESDDVMMLKQKEVELISRYTPSYNMTTGGDGVVGMKRDFTDEHCRHLSESLKGKPFSEEHRKRLSDSAKGKHLGPLSEERKLHISEGRKARFSRPGDTK